MSRKNFKKFKSKLGDNIGSKKEALEGRFCSNDDSIRSFDNSKTKDMI